MKASATPRGPRAFTLIELLIVVAIIAILAAIAVPNFLEAQTRSKVSRTKADIRSITTALEAYRVDGNAYPPTPWCNGGDVGVIRVIPDQLSTPVAFITTASFIDPFISANVGDFQMITRTGNVVDWTPIWPPNLASRHSPYEPKDSQAGKRYYYQSNRDGRRSAGVQADLLTFAVPSQGDWVITSLGPNRRRDVLLAGGSSPFPVDVYIPYDPTNGTVSDGDIIRTQRESDGSFRP
ncbi:MAG: prepilin-type N-terminal cleavage/methylation domain-containing protein [Candidatus Sumerlaeia bacterium]|nr:prepilin-type N-terminal cleavage/methylation domain-containing protein [Candidatus Sumerlaeia bacterium]